jgi:hypothetical protein
MVSDTEYRNMDLHHPEQLASRILALALIAMFNFGKNLKKMKRWKQSKEV